MRSSVVREYETNGVGCSNSTTTTEKPIAFKFVMEWCEFHRLRCFQKSLSFQMVFVSPSISSGASTSRSRTAAAHSGRRRTVSTSRAFNISLRAGHERRLAAWVLADNERMIRESDSSTCGHGFSCEERKFCQRNRIRFSIPRSHQAQGVEAVTCAGQ